MLSVDRIREIHNAGIVAGKDTAIEFARAIEEAVRAECEEEIRSRLAKFPDGPVGNAFDGGHRFGLRHALDSLIAIRNPPPPTPEGTG